VPQLSRQTDREKIDNVPPEVQLRTSVIAKKVLDDFCPKQALQAPISRRKNQKALDRSRGGLFAINLETHIHFSKSLLPEKMTRQKSRRTRVSQSFKKTRMD
jgi:hypothetical protein